MTSRPRDLALLKRFDDVARPEVLEVGQTDAALESGCNLACVVLEAPQRGDGALPDDGPFTQEPHLRAAGDLALSDIAPGDGADTRDAEDLPHFGFPGDDLLVER